MNKVIASPCIRHCCLNDDDICQGCSRSLDEIKRWMSSSNEEKQQIMLEVHVRASSSAAAKSTLFKL